jgi:cytochrome c biogenesis protein CcmG/thiol:disulfide interchange protein DsbE
MRTRFGSALVALASLTALILVGLTPEPNLAASPPVARPLPEFVLPQVRDPSSEFRSEEIIGEPALLNV